VSLLLVLIKGTRIVKEIKRFTVKKSSEVWEKRRGNHVECGARLGVR
jgi:hypothetical protein